MPGGGGAASVRPAGAAARGGAGAAARARAGGALGPLPVHAVHRRTLLRAARAAVRRRLPDREYTNTPGREAAAAGLA